MAYYAGEDDFYQYHPDTIDDHMEERLVEALGYHVQNSVNQALINALKPSAQPLRRFGQRELKGRPLHDSGSHPDQLSNLGIAQGALKRPLSFADVLANMAASVMQDHGYDVYSSLDTSEAGREASRRPEGLPSSSSHSSGSDHDQEDPKPVGKRKRKSHNTQERSSSYRNLFFDPERPDAFEAERRAVVSIRPPETTVNKDKDIIPDQDPIPPEPAEVEDVVTVTEAA
ncbi:hypothetical protein NDU88_006626 [Pleurodeles waltl]|uniref:Uncharacterized protein n=1 Tax=Pleurodeles waltl TaxID=8319 RepID=A0AAV7LPM6_PLEWA|nr:hypothetical protein NDU88_006626 [Pleurodeles waltl]